MSQNRSVSAHLQIALDEYDAKIRTFVPYYEEMLNVVGDAFDAKASPRSTLLELGIGTGALSGRCRDLRPDISVIGIDADAGILGLARDRLGSALVDLRAGDFTSVDLPECDAIVSSLALHHVGTAEEKRALYRRCFDALNDSGFMLIADCLLPDAAAEVVTSSLEWKRFLELSYSPQEATDLLDAWSKEDTYFALTDELEWLRETGFRVDVLWQRGMFGVILCQ